MTSDDAVYLDARPSIEVADLDAALAFWTDIVGFETEVVMGDPPSFAMVHSGGARIGLARTDQPAVPEIAAMFVTLRNLDALVERLATAGITLDAPTTTRPWGIRDLVVRCPGGGPLLAFGEEIEA